MFGLSPANLLLLICFHCSCVFLSVTHLSIKQVNPIQCVCSQRLYPRYPYLLLSHYSYLYWIGGATKSAHSIYWIITRIMWFEWLPGGSKWKAACPLKSAFGWCLTIKTAWVYISDLHYHLTQMCRTQTWAVSGRTPMQQVSFTTT